MQKFLVVSYDDSEQQFFWDFVVAGSYDKATTKVCKDRPYVLAADAMPYPELIELSTKLDKMSFGEIKADYKRTIKEA